MRRLEEYLLGRIGKEEVVLSGREKEFMEKLIEAISSLPG